MRNGIFSQKSNRRNIRSQRQTDNTSALEMCDEKDKDMIEINLTAPFEQQQQSSRTLHKVNYLGNIRFTRSASNATNSFPYDQQCNEDEKASTAPPPPPTVDPTLRQLYCPDCQQRLDATTVRYEKFFTCCLPIMPLQRFYRSALKKRHVPRKLFCGKCGCSLGYWEKCA